MVPERGSEWANMADIEEKERENEEESEGKEKENFVGELNMVLVLLSLSESKDEESKEEEESIRRSDHAEVTAKARTSKLQPKNFVTMHQPKFVRRPSSKPHTSIKDIRHGRKM